MRSRRFGASGGWLGDAELGGIWVAARLFGIGMAVRYLRSPNPRLSARLLRRFGARVGEGTTIKGALYLDNVAEDRNSAGDFRHLTIGGNCYLGEGVYLDLAHEVLLEQDVVVAGQVAFVTHADCNRSAALEGVFPRECEPIVVRSGCWLGFRALVMPGVTIGPNSVIAAGALVREDVPEQAVYAGVPARKVRDLFAGQPIRPARDPQCEGEIAPTRKNRP